MQQEKRTFTQIKPAHIRALQIYFETRRMTIAQVHSGASLSHTKRVIARTIRSLCTLGYRDGFFVDVCADILTTRNISQTKLQENHRELSELSDYYSESLIECFIPATGNPDEIHLTHIPAFQEKQMMLTHEASLDVAEPDAEEGSIAPAEIVEEIQTKHTTLDTPHFSADTVERIQLFRIIMETRPHLSARDAAIEAQEAELELLQIIQ
jgi:hypothetical protein